MQLAKKYIKMLSLINSAIIVRSHIYLLLLYTCFTLCCDTWMMFVVVVGHRRAAALQEHVGAILSRRQRYSVSIFIISWCLVMSRVRNGSHACVCVVQVHGWCGRSGEDRGVEERAAQLVRQTTAAGNPSESDVIVVWGLFMCLEQVFHLCVVIRSCVISSGSGVGQ